MLWSWSVLFKQLGGYAKFSIDTNNGYEYVSTCTIVLSRCYFAVDGYE